ncbi:MAG: anhydro-N-acetylmuramic acid kinase [Planctomycetota bacterium]
MNPLDRLCAVRDKRERLVLGLSSGTSADGIDAALVQIRGSGMEIEVEPVAGKTYPYDRHIRKALIEMGRASADEICRMNFDVGGFFAERALEFIEENGLVPEQVDLIGSHGQTIYHIPRAPGAVPSTLQIGEPDVIAEKTRIPVVADFRTRDVAAGGDGAPLIPYVDFLLFRRSEGTVALQNIGGIANVSVVGTALEEVIAFDTGPGNMPLDHVAKVMTRGEEAFDRDGKRAAHGRIDENLLASLLTHPFFGRRPPKSTGREAFGEDYVLSILRSKGNQSIADVLATMTAFVAKSIYRAYEEYVFPKTLVSEVILSGGGVKNLTLVSHLEQFFHPIPVTSIADHGFDPDLKEAVAFAVLASESVAGNPNNVPVATGAHWPVVLGKISP